MLQSGQVQLLMLMFAGLVIYYPQILELLKQWLENYYLSRQDAIISLEFTTAAQQKRADLFTVEQLATYNGVNGAPLYLALLGSIYDVSKGIKHYGAGNAYNFFIGRDASVSFVTGEFENYDPQQADNVLQLKSSDLLSLAHWQRFYNKEYEYKGKLIGRFYDADGEPTVYYHKYLALLEQAERDKEKETQQRSKYPDCNIEWSSETKNTHVWCTVTSGGKQREWIGYPRKLYELGKNSYRCACINAEDLQTTSVMLKAYDNCERDAHECYYHVN